MRFTFKNLVKRLARDERGATLVEYGVAVVLAVIVGTGGLIALAGNIDGNMDTAGTAMTPDCSGATCVAGAGFPTGTP